MVLGTSLTRLVPPFSIQPSDANNRTGGGGEYGKLLQVYCVPVPARGASTRMCRFTGSRGMTRDARRV